MELELQPVAEKLIIFLIFAAHFQVPAGDVNPAGQGGGLVGYLEDGEVFMYVVYERSLGGDLDVVLDRGVRRATSAGALGALRDRRRGRNLRTAVRAHETGSRVDVQIHLHLASQRDTIHTAHGLRFIAPPRCRSFVLRIGRSSRDIASWRSFRRSEVHFHPDSGNLHRFRLALRILQPDHRLRPDQVPGVVVENWALRGEEQVVLTAGSAPIIANYHVANELCGHDLGPAHLGNAVDRVIEGQVGLTALNGIDFGSLAENGDTEGLQKHFAFVLSFRNRLELVDGQDHVPRRDFQLINARQLRAYLAESIFQPFFRFVSMTARDRQLDGALRRPEVFRQRRQSVDAPQKMAVDPVGARQ